MGSKAEKDEQPIHYVVIRRPFLMGRGELSQAFWDRVGGHRSPLRQWRDPELPIDMVSWDQAKAWLGKAGDGLRLPTEAEWEYACRAGGTTAAFWGDESAERYAWHEGNSGGRTHPFSAHADRGNAFGLVDMLGNLWEWCEDSWIPDYRSGPKTEVARVTEGQELRAIRGSCWSYPPNELRSSNRNLSSRRFQGVYLGVRLARSLAFDGGR